MADVAIVGGGVGGLYLGDLLRKNAPSDSATIYEASNRVGGRIYSPPLDSTIAECGPMRYIPAAHQRLHKLIGDLELKTGLFCNKVNFFHIGGRRFNPSDASTKETFNLFEQRKKDIKILITEMDGSGNVSLSEPEEKKPPHELSLRDAFTRLGQLTSEQRQSHRETLKSYLRLNGWDETIADASAEAWLLHEKSYEAMNENSNLARHHTVIGGFQQITVKLGERFKTNGGQIITKRFLEKLEYSNQKFTLTFKNGVRDTAQKVVLAIPPRAFCEITIIINGGAARFPDPNLNPKGCPDTPNGWLQAYPKTKIFACYQEPPWEKFDIQEGKVITDRKIGEIYYYSGQNGGKRTFIMSYSGGDHAKSWHEFQTNRTIEHLVEGSRELIRKLQEELKTIHGTQDIPEPIRVCCCYWPAAYYAWRPGVKVKECVEKMYQPIADVPLFIVGEAYSNQQGNIEGALETAEKVYQKLSVC